MRYFITGATGFVGGAVALQLVAEGHTVVALARQPDCAHDLTQLGIKVVAGDVTDAPSLLKPMEGADGVFHIAGWYKIGSRDRTQGAAINIDGTRNVLNAMKQLGIPRGVYTSTLAVNGDTHGTLVDESYSTAGGPWLTEYDRTKWVAHHEVAEPMIREGLPLVVVMPGAVYGPNDPSALGDTLRMYLRRQLPLAPKGTAFCWGFIDDIARAHILAMEKGSAGERYIIAGPPHSLIEALAIAERITGIKAPRMHPGPNVMRSFATLLDWLGTIMPLPAAFSGEAMRTSAAVTYIGDNAKAKRELGFDPRPLGAGLSETLRFEMARNIARASRAPAS